MNALLSKLCYTSAGESHGPALVAILEGIPRGLVIDRDAVDAELRRRQGGAGRGGRQRLEHDRLELTGGMRAGATIGSPLALRVENRDDTIETLPEPTRPRPGHADLAGCYRYLDRDIRGTLERASARETATRVAAGSIARQLLAAVGCEIFGFVRAVGGAALADPVPGCLPAAGLPDWRGRRDRTSLYTLDRATDEAMLAAVRAAGRAGDTVGGIVEVQVASALPGLGSCLQWSERLDARLTAAIVSIPAFKGAEIGLGFAAGGRSGSAVHDAILPGDDGQPRRATNRAGGLEGGMTNGENVVVRGVMKPISTLVQPLASVDLATGEPATAGYERSDVCAVSAASVVAEAMVALVIADAALARLGGETLDEFRARWQEHQRRVRDISR